MVIYAGKDYQDVSRKAANIMSAQIIMKPDAVLGLATGSTPVGMYAQLAEWYRSRRFCGRCGASMVHSTEERMMQCPECGLMEYPKISPAVIIGLVHGNKILMSKYAGRAYKNYALLAGFSEIGESVEETVRREVMEEVGLKVGKLHYYKSQPWGFDSNLLMGFFCDLAEEGEIRLEEEELSLAEWVDYRDVPDDPEGLSLTREMMTYFRKQREQGLNP